MQFSENSETMKEDEKPNGGMVGAGYSKAKRVSYSLPESLADRLAREAAANDRSTSQELKRRLQWSFDKESK